MVNLATQDSSLSVENRYFTRSGFPPGRPFGILHQVKLFGSILAQRQAIKLCKSTCLYQDDAV